MRSKITGPGAAGGATVVWVAQYIREAIQPFIDLKIASSMYVEADRVSDQQINALIRLYRGPTLAIELRYQILWLGIEAISDTYGIGQEPLTGSSPL